MYCVRCGNIGNKQLFRCVACYQDGWEDSNDLICGKCKEDHDECNECEHSDNEKCDCRFEWETFVECGECGNVLHKETGTPWIANNTDEI